jgi:hypothetical protein
MGSACCASSAVGDFAVAMSSQRPQSKSRHTWVVLYWMPYDNDLTRFGEPIVKMLTRGTQNSEIAVAIQSDYQGDRKMRRRLLTNGSIQEIDVTGEDSSDVSGLSAYLEWASQTLAAERWAVIVMGHGGKINEISPDDRGMTRQNRTWMRVDRFADAVSNFNRASGGGIELLFFQNCNKATLEVIYEARNCARYTLASQLNLGAPNYYYQGFLNRLRDSSVDGRAAAIAIANSDRADMYHSLTLVDNNAVKRIPARLSRSIEPLLSHPLPAIDLSKISTYQYSGERHCDALALLGYLSKVSGQGQTEFSDFVQFLQSSAIAFYKTGGKLYGASSNSDTNSEELCGLGLYLPEIAPAIDRYSSLALYREVNMVGLYQTLLRAF